MSLITILSTLAIIGFALWLIMQIPMPPPFKNIMLGVVILVLVLWILKHLGSITL